jgi:hypothetical protein
MAVDEYYAKKAATAILQIFQDDDLAPGRRLLMGVFRSRLLVKVVDGGQLEAGVRLLVDSGLCELAGRGSISLTQAGWDRLHGEAGPIGF